MFLETGEPRRGREAASVPAVALAADFAARAARARVRAARDGCCPQARTAMVRGCMRSCSTSRCRWATASVRERTRSEGDAFEALGAGDRGQPNASGGHPKCSAPRPAARRCWPDVEHRRAGLVRLDYGQLMRSIDAVLRSAELPVVIDLVTDIQQSGLPTRFGELAPRRPAGVRDPRRCGRR